MRQLWAAPTSADPAAGGWGGDVRCQCGHETVVAADRPESECTCRIIERRSFRLLLLLLPSGQADLKAPGPRHPTCRAGSVVHAGACPVAPGVRSILGRPRPTVTGRAPAQRNSESATLPALRWKRRPSASRLPVAVALNSTARSAVARAPNNHQAQVSVNPASPSCTLSGRPGLAGLACQRAPPHKIEWHCDPYCCLQWPHWAIGGSILVSWCLSLGRRFWRLTLIHASDRRPCAAMPFCSTNL
jgi:hypothetical protein